MAKKDKNTASPGKNSKKLLLFAFLPLILFVAILAAAYLFFLHRIYPAVFVGNINLSAQTRDEARITLHQSIDSRANTPLKFTYQNQNYQIDLSSVAQNADYESTLTNALRYGHSQIYFSPVHLNLTTTTLESIDAQIQMIAQSVNQPPIDSSLIVDKDQISVGPSRDGQSLDEEKLKNSILTYLINGQTPENQLPIKIIPPKLSYTSALEIKKTLDQIKLSPIRLAYKTVSANDDDFTQDLDLPTIISLIDLQNSKSTLVSGKIMDSTFSISNISVGDNQISDIKLTLNQNKLSDYLKTLAAKINRPVEEPLLSFDQTAAGGKGKVTEFRPPQDGRTLDVETAAQLIAERLLSANLTEIQLPVQTVQPKNKLVNDLGIKELLAEGTSHFYHSSADRIFNLELAASRVNGTLVAPGDTFSFDATVGDITAATGYHQGYVIESGKTVLDDGGGVCQDPTTLFRAVLKAGLPVVARTAHAYRVGYYEQDSPPGLDATIYSPSVDLKFKNDTPAYILIQAHADEANYELVYDLYGTSDGRTSSITTPVILSTSPALPDIRQDDPTLPVGTVKQVDFAVRGANVVFSRTVTRGGQTLINETYHSNYRPWQNVYLVGTKTN